MSFGGTGLRNIVLPQSILSIGDSGFENCVNLESVTSLNSNPPSLYASGVFPGKTFASATLYVPAEAGERYKNDWYWKNFRSIQAIGSTGIEATMTGGQQQNVAATADGIAMEGAAGLVEVYSVDGTLVFLENRPDGFDRYLSDLAATRRPGVAGAIVMNANPFTLGHRYLVETAARACDVLHLFVLSEDASLVPFAVRRRLVQEGVAELPNVVLHDSGPYIISSATFPSYFLKDTAAVNENHARLDIAVFARIAQALGITKRFVGEEPASRVTSLYNRVMLEELPKAGVACEVVPRLASADGIAVSASTVRQALRDGDFERVRELVPASTYDYFTSVEAAPVLERMRAADNVIHY